MGVRRRARKCPQADGLRHGAALHYWNGRVSRCVAIAWVRTVLPAAEACILHLYPAAKVLRTCVLRPTSVSDVGCLYLLPVPR